MPLWRLQRVGHEDIRFLYEPGPGADCITLLPGVACHLRERAPLIRRLAQTEWLRFVLSLKQNQPVLGRAVGLSEFLFGSSRAGSVAQGEQAAARTAERAVLLLPAQPAVGGRRG